MKRKLSPLEKFKPLWEGGKSVEQRNIKVGFKIRMYVVSQLTALRAKNPNSFSQDDINELTKMIMDLKQDKTTISAEDQNCALEDYQTFLSDFFSKVDYEDRHSTVTMKTISKFRLMSSFIDVLTTWQPLDEEMIKCKKYCQYKAVDIFKALKNGQVPKRGGPKEQLEEKKDDDAALGDEIEELSKNVDNNKNRQQNNNKNIVPNVNNNNINNNNQQHHHHGQQQIPQTQQKQIQNNNNMNKQIKQQQGQIQKQTNSQRTPEQLAKQKQIQQPQQQNQKQTNQQITQQQNKQKQPQQQTNNNNPKTQINQHHHSHRNNQQNQNQIPNNNYNTNPTPNNNLKQNINSNHANTQIIKNQNLNNQSIKNQNLKNQNLNSQNLNNRNLSTNQNNYKSHHQLNPNISQNNTIKIPLNKDINRQYNKSPQNVKFSPKNSQNQILRCKQTNPNVNNQNNILLKKSNNEMRKQLSSRDPNIAIHHQKQNLAFSSNQQINNQMFNKKNNDQKKNNEMYKQKIKNFVRTSKVRPSKDGNPKKRLFKGKYDLNARIPLKYNTVPYFMLIENVRLNNEDARVGLKRGKVNDILNMVLDSLEFLSYVHK